MKLLSAQFILTLQAVLDIAISSTEAPVEGRLVMDRQGISPRYLEPTLQALVRNRILKGVRGPKGGYVMGRERDSITLLEIHNVVSEGETRRKAEPTISALRRIVIEPLIAELTERWSRDLAKITLEDLYQQAIKLAAYQRTEDHSSYRSGARLQTASAARA
jgi:Rrf2 family protein